MTTSNLLGTVYEAAGGRHRVRLSQPGGEHTADASDWGSGRALEFDDEEAARRWMARRGIQEVR